MTDPFAMALGVLFNSPLAVAAEYTPAGGDTVAIRVIRTRAGQTVGFGGSTLILDTDEVSIQIADVAMPKDGDAVGLSDGSFVLQGGPKIDAEGLSHNCPIVPA